MIHTTRLQGRDLCMQLQRASISLHGAQQLLLEGLAVSLTVDSTSGRTSSGYGGEAGVAGSPHKPPYGSPAKQHGRRRDWQAASQEQGVPLLRVERLMLQHQHDGTFCLHQLNLQAAGGGSPLSTAAAGPQPEAGSSCSLQRVSVELGAVALWVSKPLLQWVQQQKQQAAEAKLRRQSAKRTAAAGAAQLRPGGDDGERRLLSLLGLLPRECALSAASCSIASDSGGGTPGISAGTDGRQGLVAELPLAAAFELHGVRLHLGKGLPGEAADSNAESKAEARGLLAIAAGWQRLAISLGAAGAVAPGPGASGRGQPLPSALAMSSGTAEWSLDLLQPAAAAFDSSSSAGSSCGESSTQEALDGLLAIGEVGIGALHTDVCYPAVQPLVERLREATAAVKRAVTTPPAATAASAGSAAAVSGANSRGVPTLEVPADAAWGAGQAKRPAVPLLASWQTTVRLGDGSRLLFSDAAGRCCWSSGLASCRLAVQGGSDGSGPGRRSSSYNSIGRLSSSISVNFEVEGIEMYAVATALGSAPTEHAAMAVPAGGQLQLSSPPQMLAAQLLRIEARHAVPPTRQGAAPQHQTQEQQAAQAAGVEGQQLSSGTSVDATTSGVHLLVQQQQLATVASVIVSLLPPAREAERPPTPEETAAAADSLLQAASRAALTAAAAAVAPPARHSRRLQLSFACADTVLLLPTTVTAPAAHCTAGMMLLLPAAPALLLSSVSGRLGDATGDAAAHVEGCSLLYCEGAASQRFPGSSDALKGEPTGGQREPPAHRLLLLPGCVRCDHRQSFCKCMQHLVAAILNLRLQSKPGPQC